MTNAYFLLFTETADVLCELCNCEIKMDIRILLQHTKSCRGTSRDDSSYRFVCIFCRYHCAQNESMKRHLRKHTKDKPFKCEFCEFKFSRKDNLRRHLKDTHDYELVIYPKRSCKIKKMILLQSSRSSIPRRIAISERPLTVLDIWLKLARSCTHYQYSAGSNRCYAFFLN